MLVWTCISSHTWSKVIPRNDSGSYSETSSEASNVLATDSIRHRNNLEFLDYFCNLYASPSDGTLDLPLERKTRQVWKINTRWLQRWTFYLQLKFVSMSSVKWSKKKNYQAQSAVQYVLYLIVHPRLCDKVWWQWWPTENDLCGKQLNCLFQHIPATNVLSEFKQ